MALWREILPDDFIARPRLSRIYYNGKFFSYPLKAFEALVKLGVFESTACLVSYLYARIFPVAETRTFHDWVRNQFGERLFRIFFKTYTETVWGMSCDEISADWAAQRIKGLDLATAVLNGVKRSLPFAGNAARDGGGGAVKTLIESFQYPRKGPGMMWDAAARRIKARGGPPRSRRHLPIAACDRAKRYAPLQQPGPCDDDGHAHRAKYPRRRAALRRVERQRRRRISRGRRARRAKRARQRAAGSGKAARERAA